MSIPAICLNISPVRWADEPLPGEPKFNLPGLALACLSSSPMLDARNAGLATSTRSE